jgi:hypothetical protein
MPKIKLTLIKCIRPEEREDHPWEPGDELRLDARVDSDKYFTLAVWRGKGFVTGTEGRIERTWTFKESIEFRLMELDPYTEDEVLGKKVVRAGAKAKNGKMHFTRLGAHYTLDYVHPQGTP